MRCNRCRADFDPTAEPAGLAFSPPFNGNHVSKYHLCDKCWILFLHWLDKLDYR